MFYHALINGPDGVLYIPEYNVHLQYSDGRERLYFGVLESVGPSQTFEELLAKYYAGDLFALALTRTWGGYEERDADLVADIGVSYRTYRCDKTGDSRTFASWSNGRWLDSAPTDPISAFQHLCEERQELMLAVIDALGRDVY